MKLETFFEKFDQFADAPDAVAKMQALLIQLAVQGKLVPNDSSESPVRLKLSGEGGNAAPLPSNWRSGLLGDVLSFEYGDNLPAPKRSESGEYPVYGSNGIVGTHDTYLTREPAIIIGRKGSAGALNISAGPSWTTDVAYFVRPPRELDLSYTYYLLASLRLDELGKGIKPGLSRKEAYALPVAIPPLAEQKRIVAKVDELMALCDRLQAQEKERKTRHTALSHAAIARFDEAANPANLNFLFHPSYSVTPADLRKTILNLAVQGKLVPQKPSDGHASEVLKRLNRSRLDQQSWNQQKNSSPTEQIRWSSGEQLEIPETWVWVRLGDLVSSMNNGIYKPAKFFSEAGVACVRMFNIQDGYLDLSKLKRLILSDDEAAQYQLQAGDLLVNRVNSRELVGKTALVRVHNEPLVFEAMNIRVRLLETQHIPEYVNLVLRTERARGYFQNCAKQAIGQASINQTQLADIPIPLPPLLEQSRIIVKLDKLMTIVDELETLLTASQLISKELLDAVVHELLHPIADIVEFPRSDSDRASQRAAIGCYAIEHLLRNPSFGRVMLMKACYLSETHLGLPLGWQPMRQAAGPWDPWIEDFESLGTRGDWFAVTEKALYNGHSKIEYSAKKGIKTKAAEAIKLLGSQKAEFDRLLDLFADKSTEDAEIITTLFAAWNDFLIDGKMPTDDEIIHEVRENWHVSKQRFTSLRLATWLKWIRDNNMSPSGHPPRTRQQLMLSLN